MAAAGAILWVFAVGTGEPLAEIEESAASTRTTNAVRHMEG
jgi:hypothetical protein